MADWLTRFPTPCPEANREMERRSIVDGRPAKLCAGLRERRNRFCRALPSITANRNVPLFVFAAQAAAGGGAPARYRSVHGWKGGIHPPDRGEGVRVDEPSRRRYASDDAPNFIAVTDDAEHGVVKPSS